MGERDQRLPTSTYAILGLLTFGEMSGYDLVKLVNRSVGLFWTPAKSQIYSELQRLVSLGYATEREVEQRDRPDKRMFRITERGEAALRGWLGSPEVEPEVVRMPHLVRLFFGHLAERETLVTQVKEVRRRGQENLERFREIERQIADSDEHFFPYLTLMSGLAHAQATVRWADEVLQKLEERGR